jgi:antitoxin ParD1/3/4
VRDLIRKDQDRQKLRGMLLSATTRESSRPADEAYFDSLRQRVRRAEKSGNGK